MRTPTSGSYPAVAMTRGLACSIALVLGLALGGPAHAGPRMLKGPYLQDLAPSSITVMWQLDSPTAARLIVTGPDGERTQEVAASKITEARLTALRPATRYRYRVLIGDASWQGEFATAPEVGADVPFSFVVIGDTRYSADAHRRVIERVSQEVPDFVLGTGDMVDEGHRQEQWQQFFEIENQLLRDNVYFPALGNHDRQGRGRSAEAYGAFFSVPTNGGHAERYYAFSYASARFLVLDSNEYSFALTDQTAWLERELVAARQDPQVRHIFCVMHHPPFSVSLHGGHRDLRERWGSLFETYGVTAVFSGHDHVYERAEHNGIRYFVTGGGGAPLYARRPRPDPIDAAAVKKYERAYHYLRVTVTGQRVEISAIRTDGTAIETTTWTEAAPPSSEVREAPALVTRAGGPAPAPQLARAPTGPAPRDGSLAWIGFAGIGLLLGAAVIVVRTLRR